MLAKIEMHWKIAGLFVISLLASPAVDASDLMEAYRLAQLGDPAFQAATYALETARQKIPQARAGLLPVVSMTGNEGTTSATTTFSDVLPVDRNMRAWSWNLQLTQPLLRVGSLYAYRESGYLVMQAEAQFAQAQQDLFLRVAQAYFGVLVAQDAIAAAEGQVTALVQQQAIVSRGLQLGTHAVTDVDDTKSRLGSARAQRIAASNTLESAQADLEKVTGKAMDNLAFLKPAALPSPPSPMNSRAWMDEARSSYPLVRAQRSALDAARETIKKTRSEHLPSLDLVANYGSNYSSRSLSTPSDYSTRVNQRQISLQLTVPLFAGGAVNSRVAEAIANMKKLEADLEAASRQAATDARQAFAGVINGLALIDSLNIAVESGLNAVKGNQAGYRLGIRVNVDVLNAQQQLYNAQKDLSKARYDTLLQGLKLKAATGALNEADLNALNSMLQ
ncbi:TolC family outer membrane protein [Undibacterium sp. CY18W]|uniref:TolC family outer membrane protein n=2 Tax=Undibacterium hunanense TaxID=2762292 RepID=A0ABR6ZVX3_9BURK|nr:TolC family outer membrane protein [Undibacterium hunanense]